MGLAVLTRALCITENALCTVQRAKAMTATPSSSEVAKKARALCDAVDIVVEKHCFFGGSTPLGALYTPGPTEGAAVPPQDRLRQNIPMVMTAGQQSAGKSSVMNGMLTSMGGWSGGCLPVKSDIATLFPTRLYLTTPDAKRAVECHIEGTGPDGPIAPTCVPADEVQQQVKATLEMMNATLIEKGKRAEGEGDGARKETVMLDGAGKYYLQVRCVERQMHLPSLRRSSHEEGSLVLSDTLLKVLVHV